MVPAPPTPRRWLSLPTRVTIPARQPAPWANHAAGDQPDATQIERRCARTQHAQPDGKLGGPPINERATNALRPTHSKSSRIAPALIGATRSTRARLCHADRSRCGQAGPVACPPGTEVARQSGVVPSDLRLFEARHCLLIPRHSEVDNNCVGRPTSPGRSGGH